VIEIGGVKLWCFLCAMPFGELRRDKKGGVYFICRSCGCRLFIKSQPGLDGVMRLLKEAEAGGRQRFEEYMRAAADSAVGPQSALKEALVGRTSDDRAENPVGQGSAAHP
jgi:hypothetical protein